MKLHRLGDWADDIAFQDTGGAASNQQAAAGQLPATGSFLSPPATNNRSSPSMWTSLISGVFNQGNAASQTFVAGANAYQRQSMAPYLLAGGALVVGVGILAWVSSRR